MKTILIGIVIGVVFLTLDMVLGQSITINGTVNDASGASASYSAGASISGGGGGGGAASVPFTPLHTYYISPTGSDAANGLSPATAWASPNHAVVCGDVIVAAAGSYTTTGWSFGAVSACPSVTGGIDDMGGVYFATLLCGGADLASCPLRNGSGSAINVQRNNWAVEGFMVNGGGTMNSAFVVNGNPTKIHHVAFVNNIAYGVGIGFSALDNCCVHDVPGVSGYDYVATVGNVAQNAELNTVCTAAIVYVAPGAVDNVPGTHYFMYGNFAYNQPNNGCGIDIENYMIDTFDAHGVTNRFVVMNNVGWSAYRYGLQIFYQNFNNVNGSVGYVLNNTLYNNNLVASLYNGDLNIQQNNASSPTIMAQNNVLRSVPTSGWGALQGSSAGASGLTNVRMGTQGNENVIKGNSTSCPATCDPGRNAVVFNGGSLGTNFYVDPAFNNTADLLSNRTGAPSCTGFASVTACMGWNPVTQVLANPSVIYDLTPACAQCAGKGYQKPSSTCVTSVTAPDGTVMYPSWLKGIVRLQWHPSTSTVTEESDLVTKPCNM